MSSSNRCSFEDSGTADTGPLSGLSASISGQRGEISSINFNIEGETQGSYELWFGVDVPSEIDDRFIDYAERVRGAFTVASEVSGLQAPDSPDTGFDLPDQLQNLQSYTPFEGDATFEIVSGDVPEELQGDIIGQDFQRETAPVPSGGFPDEVTVSQDISWEPIPVPSIGGERFNVDELPPIIVRVRAWPSDIVGRIGSSLGGGSAVYLSMPACVLFEPVQVDCIQAYGDLSSEIESARSSINNAMTEAQQEIDTLQDIQQNVRDIRDTDIRDLTVQDLVGAITDETNLRQNLRNAVERFRNTDRTLTSQRVNDIGDQVNNIEQRLDEVADPCIDEVGSGFDEVNSRYDELFSRFNEVSSIRDNLSRLLDNLPSDIIQEPESQDCFDKYTVISTWIDNLRQRAEGGFDSVEEARVELENARNIREEITGTEGGVSEEVDAGPIPRTDPCRQRLLAEIAAIGIQVPDVELDCTDVPQELRTRVNDFPDTVRSWLNQSPSQRRSNRREQIISEGENIRSEVEERISEENQCKQELLSRINSSIGDLRETPILDCADVPRGLRNRANGFEGSVSSFINLSRQNRSDRRLQDLSREGSDIIEEIRSRVNDDNPCKDELMSRVRNSLNRIRGSETRLVCSEEFQDVSDQVDEFEQMILDLRPPVRPQQVQQINRDAQDIISTIQQNVPSDSNCRSNFVERIRDATNRVSSLAPRVRIEAGEGRPNNTDELIQQIIGALSGVDTPDPEDVGEEVPDEPLDGLDGLELSD